MAADPVRFRGPRLSDIAAALGAGGSASSDFDLTPGAGLPPNAVLMPAAVLIALQAHPDGLRLMLTKRSPRLRHHPGQIALPGGKQEPGDGDAETAALREAHEEIGLDPGLVRVMGHLPLHRTVTGFAITPVVAEITGPFDPVPEIGEVAEAFQVPMAHLADPGSYRVEGRRWRGRRRAYYAAPWGPYYIWGATACILRGLAARLAQ